MNTRSENCQGQGRRGWRLLPQLTKLEYILVEIVNFKILNIALGVKEEKRTTSW